MLIELRQRLDTAVDEDFQLREILLQLIGVVILQRRDLAIFLGTQALEDGIAGMHDEGLAAGLGNLADEIAHEVIGLHVIDADAVLHGHVDGHRILHGFDAIGHQAWARPSGRRRKPPSGRARTGSHSSG